MRVIIKVLKGEDCTLEVNPDTRIWEIKEEIQKVLKIPVANQKLLFLGRTLNEENEVAAYPNIKEGSKINLIIKRPDTLHEVVYRATRKFYTEEQSQQIAKQFSLEFDRSLSQLSLDDIERMCFNILYNS